MIRRIRRWYRSLRFRLEHGFSYKETWNLDVALAEWLGKRLRGLAKVTNGYPYGYAGTYGSTGMEAWVNDLMKHSSVCLLYSRESFNYDESEDGYILCADYKNTLRWVADHVEHLWW